MKKCLVLLLLLSSLLCHSQDRCGFAVGEKAKQKANPDYLKRKAEFEYSIREILKNDNSASRVGETVVKIPVVVHVIHNNTSNFIGGTNNTNISDEQIKSQIKVLNEDYRKKTGTNGFNTNAVGADMEIEFELATLDPSGKATTGITRTYLNQASWDFLSQGTELASKAKWNYEKYLNIWVAKSNGNTIGYAEFPYDSKLIGLAATTQDINDQKIFDGVIVDYRNFGTCCGTLSSTYNLGRTLTHEIGHWLGLLHINDDETCGDDYCNDTPKVESLNNVTNCNPKTTNCTGKSLPAMIENYMDYSPDRCMNIFTIDQKKRTRAALEASPTRKRLLVNVTPIPETETLTISVQPNPATSNPYVKVQFKGEKNVQISILDFRGIVQYEENYDTQKSNIFQVKTEKLNQGVYIVRINTGTETATQKFVFVK
jgi:Pregnancy-associated plasma protein-A/Secretion system C-terminal sorting domain